MRLRRYTDDRPGIARRRQGRGFRYIDPEGVAVTCSEELSRIKALAIPPAYQDVWISPFPNNHLLATGCDEKGRKQYIYHETWRAAREAEKFADLSSFGATLPRLRRWIVRRLAHGGDDKETAIAIALALIERGSLRPGAPSYTRENASYGVTTLLPRHFTRDGSISVLSYTAKGGQPVEKRVRGQRLAELLDLAKDHARAKLIMWKMAEGKLCAVQPADLNDRLADLCGDGASVKSLRTWNGTLAAFRVAQATEKVTKKAMAEAAAEMLHNTPAIAQKSYIHPLVLEFAEVNAEGRKNRLASNDGQAARGFRSGERALLELLRPR